MGRLSYQPALGWGRKKGMHDQPICPESGSTALIESGLFTHGTWVHSLTCWTCSQCREIVAVAGVSESLDG